MNHLGDDDVAGHVSGERLDDSVVQHLDGCPPCRDRVARTSRVVRALRRAGSDTVILERPHSQVWDAIKLAVDTSAVDASDTGFARPPVDDEAPRHGREPTHRLAVASDPPSARTDQRWSRGQVVAASVAAFAVGVAAATVGVLALDRGGQDPGQDGSAATTTAVGELSPLEGQRVRGSARVLQDTTGRQITISLDDGAAASDAGFVQAWLLDARTNDMVALGVLAGRRGTFAVPAALDLAAYDFVDLSLEPYDGDPAHSAVSLARGELRPT